MLGKCINNAGYSFTLGKEYEIFDEAYDSLFVKVVDDCGRTASCHRKRFEAPDPKDNAISLLTSLGYTIEPPKPKLSGRMQVIRSASGNILGYPVSQKIADTAVVLAVIDWTEGEGI